MTLCVRADWESIALLVPGMSVLQCVTRFLGMDIAPEIFEMPVRHVGAWRVPRLLVCHGLRLDLVWQEYVDKMRGYEVAGAYSSTNLERVRCPHCTRTLDRGGGTTMTHCIPSKVRLAAVDQDPLRPPPPSVILRPFYCMAAVCRAVSRAHQSEVTHSSASLL